MPFVFQGLKLTGSVEGPSAPPQHPASLPVFAPTYARMHVDSKALATGVHAGAVGVVDLGVEQKIGPRLAMSHTSFHPALGCY